MTKQITFIILTFLSINVFGQTADELNEQSKKLIEQQKFEEAIFSALALHYFNYNGGNSQWNHDLFTIGNYRTKMAQNLVNIHPWLNDANNDFLTNVNSDSLNLYGDFTLEQLMEYVSWIGLEGTQDFINTIQNSPLEHTKKNYVENAARAKYTNNCN